uniref:Evolutionarily conserved signaling intermediate in Toll pathway, mitochondrial n=1 Tax=Meloidogyne enterolobii TaxID=390850 RepID=A0A6V7W3M1_MELEN|nr:unnamed protein product [Meloidogyne enterolobii]
MLKSLFIRNSIQYLLLKKEKLIYLRVFQAYQCSSKPNYKTTQPIIWDEFFQRESEVADKTKEAFLQCVKLFVMSRGKRGGGQVEFINAGRNNMKAFGVHKDLDVYKELLKVFPEGDFVPENPLQRAFWHYPLHQECAIKLMDAMEANGVLPDKEIHDIMEKRFGTWGYATKKVKRQLYWLPKLKYTNHYLDRRLVEGKKLMDVELARVALKTMCRDAGTQITSFKAPFLEVQDRFNWVVSAQSPLQKKLIWDLPDNCTCYVDGPFRVWVRERMLNYLVLSAPPTIREDEEWVDLRTSHNVETPEELHKRLWDEGPQINVHQQSDQTILALAILGIHSNEYASVWLNHLHEENRRLYNISVVFRLKQIPKGVFKFQRDPTG